MRCATVARRRETSEQQGVRRTRAREKSFRVRERKGRRTFAQNSSGRVIEYWYIASYSLRREPSASPLEGTISTEAATSAMAVRVGGG
jgi:hypothetical protein